MWPLKQEHLHYFLVFPHQTIYEEDKTSLSNLHLIVQWCQLPTFTMSVSLIQIPSFPNKTLKFPSQTIQWQWQFVFQKSTSQSAFEKVSWLIKTALNICSKSTCTLTHYKADWYKLHFVKEMLDSVWQFKRAAERPYHCWIALTSDSKTDLFWYRRGHPNDLIHLII